MPNMTRFIPVGQFLTSIDHILETIIEYLDINSLKSCRFLSRKWRYYTALRMRNRVQISIYNSNPGINISKAVVNDSLANLNKKPEGRLCSRRVCCLSHLEALIQDSEFFPCTSFEIKCVKLFPMELKKFLCLNGSLIHKLSLSMNLQSLGLLHRDSHSGLAHSNRVFFTDFENLLVEQTPNLKSLDLSLSLPLTWEINLDRNPIPLPNFNVKHLKIRGVMPIQLFSEIMNSAIQLKSLASQGDFSSLAEYFLDGSGLERIHLLKHADILMQGEDLSILDELLAIHGETLRLESLRLVGMPRVSNKALWLCDAKTISRLLQSSSSSLKTLALSSLAILRGVDLVPMEKLKILTVFSIDPQTFRGPIGNNECCLEKIFPVLTIVNFQSYVGPSAFRNLAKILNPVKSVKRISIRKSSGEKCKITSECGNLFEIIFPNAKLQFTYL